MLRLAGRAGAALMLAAARLPYAWVPQLPRPAERAVVPPDRTTFRVTPQ